MSAKQIFEWFHNLGLSKVPVLGDRRIFEWFHDLGLSKEPILEDIAQLDYNNFKNNFYNREIALRELRRALNSAVPKGRNVMIVGSVGFGKSNLVKLILHEDINTNFGNVPCFFNTIPVTNFTEEKSTPGHTENLSLDSIKFENAIHNETKDFLKRAGVPLEKIESKADEEVYFRKIMPEHLPIKEKLILFIDDIDHLSNNSQHKAIAILYYLLESPNCSIVLTVRPPAKKMVERHPDFRIGKAFDPNLMVVIRPLNINGMLNRRLKAGSSRKKYTLIPFSIETEELIGKITNYDNRDVLRIARLIFKNYHDRWNKNNDEVNISLENLIELMNDNGILFNLYKDVLPRTNGPLNLNILEALVDCLGLVDNEFFDIVLKRYKTDESRIVQQLEYLYEYNFIDEYFHLGFIARVDPRIRKYEFTDKGKFYVFTLAKNEKYIHLCGGTRKDSLWESNAFKYKWLLNDILGFLIRRIDKNGWYKMRELFQEFSASIRTCTYDMFRNAIKKEKYYTSIDNDTFKFDIIYLRNIAKKKGLFFD
jgi:archaellum biogenesis ATPase FlaH